MQVKNVMTRRVLSVRPRTPLKEVARLLVSNAFPVCRSSTTTAA